MSKATKTDTGRGQMLNVSRRFMRDGYGVQTYTDRKTVCLAEAFLLSCKGFDGHIVHKTADDMSWCVVGTKADFHRDLVRNYVEGARRFIDQKLGRMM